MVQMQKQVDNKYVDFKNKPLILTKCDHLKIRTEIITLKDAASKRVKDLEKIKRIKFEEVLDTDDSLATENDSIPEQKPIFEKTSIEDEVFPSKDYNQLIKRG